MNKSVIGIACDHAGFEVKELIVSLLQQKGIECKDFGCYSTESCDYADPAHELGRAIDLNELSRGIALCGSGNGISMALNKHQSVRSALCWTAEIAELARQHNDANVLVIPARFVTPEQAEAILNAYLTTDFEGGRHIGRIQKIPYTLQK